jgi:hypothetical protein
MALLFMDGFDKYGNTNGALTSPAFVMQTRWAQRQHRTYTYTGRHGGYCIVSYWNNESWIQTPELTTDDTLIVGFSMYCPNPHNNGEIFQFRTQNNYNNDVIGGFALQINSDRSLSVARETTTLDTSSASVVPLADWCYVEMKLVCDNTAGSYEVRIDGVDVLSDTGVDTQSDGDGYYNVVRFNGGLSSVTPSVGMRIDDLWICDSTGSAMNDFLGSGMKIATISPDGDGDSTDWTPDTGNTNYTQIDEDVQVTANYVEDVTTNNLDLYTYESLPTIADLKAVQVVSEIQITEPNELTLKTVVKHSTTEDADAGQMVGNSEIIGKTRIMEENPVTTNAWTVSDVDSLQAGIKVG